MPTKIIVVSREPDIGLLLAWARDERALKFVNVKHEIRHAQAHPGGITGAVDCFHATLGRQ
jgi:hypothetical protein